MRMGKSRRHLQPIVGQKFTIMDTNSMGVPEDSYSTEIARRALRYDTTTTKEPDMAVPGPPFTDQLAELRREVSRLTEHVERLLRDQLVKAELTSLIARIEKLESGQPPAAATARVDELAELCFSFLQKVPGVMFNPTSVWENLGGEGSGYPNTRVAEKLESLSKRGLIQRVKKDGRNALYYFLEEA
jgi:ribosomal protein S15P/S13E